MNNYSMNVLIINTSYLKLLTMHLVFAVVYTTLIVLITFVLQFIKKILLAKTNGYW